MAIAPTSARSPGTPRTAADQLGHTDPRFTLRVYAQAAKRRERLSATHRKAYDAALEWARMGTSDALTLHDAAPVPA
jgi:hypothetical protein